MRPLRAAVAEAYRLTARRADPSADEPVEVRPGVVVPKFVADWAEHGADEAQALLARFPVPIKIAQRSVLTIGRGAGDLALEVARRDAASVVALDMAPRRLLLSEIKLAEDPRELPVDLAAYPGGLGELSSRQFDLVIATDAFRAYGEGSSTAHVDRRLAEMSSLLAAGGQLAIGAGPFWKAPFGGGTDSRMPWAHLVFPEDVIFEHFRRVRTDNQARGFGDVGINRITLARFQEAIAVTELECEIFETNVGEGRSMRVARRLSRFPLAREYLSQNAFGVWRRR